MDSGSTSTPDANRLRVISDTGQNLRHDIDDAAAPKTTAHGVLAPTGNLGVNAGPSEGALPGGAGGGTYRARGGQ